MTKLEAILTDKAPLPTTAYSQGLRFGNMLVTSGYLGTAVDGSGVVKGGFEAEVRQALDSIKAVVEAHGITLANVVRVNVSLLDVNRFADMDAIYREYFSEPYPTRNTIGVAELWGGAQVGFDVWAYVPDED
jgi:2-iminobutanoate/2-iminopropanoate deaminase